MRAGKPLFHMTEQAIAASTLSTADESKMAHPKQTRPKIKRKLASWLQSKTSFIHGAKNFGIRIPDTKKH